MKAIRLTTILLIGTAFVSTTAFASHTYKHEVIPTTESQHNWNGLYAGVNGGLMNHTMNITDNQATTFNATLQQVTGPKLTGGFQLGYRHQLDLTKTSGLYGIEFSADFTNTTFSKEYGSPFALYQLNATNELKNYLLLQAIGGIAADKTLLFLAAGLSWTNIEGSVSNQDDIAFFRGFPVSNKSLGTALGGGIEYAYNDAISVRFKIDVITPNLYTVSDGAGDNFQISNSIVQGTIGINYNFNKAKWLS